MDDEERKMLERVLEVSAQTNRIVRRIRREMILVRLVHLLYWVLIFAAAYAAYIYLLPYITNLDSLIQNLDKIKLPR